MNPMQLSYKYEDNIIAYWPFYLTKSYTAKLQ